MRKRILFAPVAAMVVFAGYLGLKLGQPMSETDIINRYAALYVTDIGDGAQVTDCLATPNLRTDVRLVVRCTHANGMEYAYYAGQRGELLPADDPQEPQA